MIDPHDLNAMRDTLDGSLPDTVTITRASLSSDGMGGQAEAWAAAGTSAARVSPGASQGVSTIAGDRVVEAAPWVVTLPVGSDVGKADRITFGTVSLEVTRTTAPRSYGLCVRVECEEVS